MSKVIHKQILNLGVTTISVPYFSRILKVDNQGGKLCVWYICEQKWLQDDGCEKWVFKGIMTGDPFDDTGWSYVDTVQFVNGGFVTHVFMNN